MDLKTYKKHSQRDFTDEFFKRKISGPKQK
jgi:hypothetical protein